jgi:hypothetical protein
MAALLSLRQYAKHRGCDPKAVRTALQSGRITALQEGKEWRIDAAKADAQWDRNTQLGKPKGRKSKETSALPIVESTHKESEPGEITPSEAFKRFNVAAAKEKEFKAKLAELECGRQSGELVEAAMVRAGTFALARQVRDAMLDIPHRVSADLAAETDEFEVHQKLTVEIKIALRTLAEEIRKLDLEEDTSNDPSGHSSKKDKKS